MNGDEAEAVYAYRPSPMAQPWEFYLGADALEWRRGLHAGSMPYRSIRRIRLSYRPTSMQSRRFVTEIWGQGPKLTIASLSWKSLVQQTPDEPAYSAFVSELHRRVARSDARPVLRAGSPALMYWPGLAILAGAGVAFVVIFIRLLSEGAWTASAIVGAFAALFLWQGGWFFRRNRPRAYACSELPPDLIPSPPSKNAD